MAKYIFENKNKKVIEDEYIHYNSENVQWNYILNYFQSNNTIEKDIKNLFGRYKKQLSNILSISINNGSSLNMMLQMNDNEILKIFNSLADKMNESVDKNLIKQLLDIENIARKNKMTVNSNGEVKNFISTMEAISKGLDLIKGFDKDQWESFVTTYQLCFNKDKKIRDEKIGKLEGFIEGIQLEPMKSVMKILSNIPKNMIKEDNTIGYNASQMTGSLNSIFDTAIGEGLAAIFQDTVFNIDKTIEKELGTKLTGKEQIKNEFSDKKVSAKTDISTPNQQIKISLQTEKNSNQDYTIKGEFNSSVKWYSPKNETPDHVAIQSISSFTNLVKKIYNDNYAVNNTIAFYNLKNNKQQADSFRIIRSSVIARNLEQFIAGSGKQGQELLGDTAAFLVVNGKFYPIFTILQAYIEDITKKENKYFNYGSSSRDLVYMNLSGVKNTWKGNKRAPSYEEGLLRSREVAQKIQKFPVRFSLNTKELEKYINKLKPVN